jgi:hypothetical protein
LNSPNARASSFPRKHPTQPIVPGERRPALLHRIAQKILRQLDFAVVSARQSQAKATRADRQAMLRAPSSDTTAPVLFFRGGRNARRCNRFNAAFSPAISAACWSFDTLRNLLVFNQQKTFVHEFFKHLLITDLRIGEYSQTQLIAMNVLFLLDVSRWQRSLHIRSSRSVSTTPSSVNRPTSARISERSK